MSSKPERPLEPPTPEESREKGRRLQSKWDREQERREQAKVSAELQRKAGVEASAQAKEQYLAELRIKEKAEADARQEKWAKAGRRGGVSLNHLSQGRAGLPEDEESDPPTRPSKSAGERYQAMQRRKR
jgi:hypothetical protein